MRRTLACLFLPLAIAGCAVDPTLGQVLVATSQVVAGPLGGALVGAAVSGGSADQALERLNGYRANAHLPPVALDAATSKICADHANYLVQNKGNAALGGFGAHKEDPSLPGATAGWSSLNLGNDIAFSAPLEAIDQLVDSLYHRTPILATNLSKVGFGSAGNAALGNAADVLAFIDGDGPEGEVAYPANGQGQVPLSFSGEYPSPIPDGAAEAGYPITLQEPSDATMTGFSGSLTDDLGLNVPCYYSDNEHQASTLFNQGNTVCLIPKTPLAPGRTYKVHVTGTLNGVGKTWDWSFTARLLP